MVTSLWNFSPFLSSVLQVLFSVLIALAVFVVVYGIFKFILHADDETERAKGRQALLWGIIGIFLMFSIWGMVWILKNTLELQEGAPPVQSLVLSYSPSSLPPPGPGGG